MGKRLAYFLSATLRLISFLGLLIAYIVVRIAKGQDILWLNLLLLILSITCLISGICNLVMCGMPAIMYKQNFVIQLLCFLKYSNSCKYWAYDTSSNDSNQKA